MTTAARRPGDFFKEIVGRPVEDFPCTANRDAAIENKLGRKLGYIVGSPIPVVSMGSSEEIDRRVEAALEPQKKSGIFFKQRRHP